MFLLLTSSVHLINARLMRPGEPFLGQNIKLDIVVVKMRYSRSKLSSTFLSCGDDSYFVI